MRRYTQLAQEQRYQIQALLKAGPNQTEIAMILGCHKSTICRELQRNRGLCGYRPKQAHRLARARQQNRCRSRLGPQDWALVESLLREEWSPEQISGRLWNVHGISISPEWIYQYLLQDKRQGGDLYRHLRCQKEKVPQTLRHLPPTAGAVAQPYFYREAPGDRGAADTPRRVGGRHHYRQRQEAGPGLAEQA